MLPFAPSYFYFLGFWALGVFPGINRGQWEASQFRGRPLQPRRDSSVPGNE